MSFFKLARRVEDPEARQEMWKRVFEYFEGMHIIRMFMSLFDQQPKEFMDMFDDIRLGQEEKVENGLIPVNIDYDVYFEDMFEEVNQLPEPCPEEDLITWMHFFLTSCLIKVTTGKGYYVKRRRVPWRFDKGIKEMLDEIDVPVTVGKKTKRVLLGKYLTISYVSKRILRRDGVEFCSENPCVMSIWPGHAWHKMEHVDMELINPYLNHCREVICNGNDLYFEIEMQKNAWMYQNPSKHLQWATFLYGPPGAGKTVYTDVLCDLWGRRFSRRNVNDMISITKEACQEMLENTKLIVCNEVANTQGTVKTGAWDIMKSRITENMMAVRKFFKNTSEVPNYCNFFLCSNHIDCVPIEKGDRRYFCLEVSDKYVGNSEYFDNLRASFEHPDFYPTLLTYFLDLDTRLFVKEHFQRPPSTQLHEDMKDTSQSYQEEFIKSVHWFEKEPVPFPEVWNKYIKWLDDQGLDSEKSAGARQQFYSKVNQWVDKKKRTNHHKGTYDTYSPNIHLRRLWEEEAKQIKEEEEARKRMLEAKVPEPVAEKPAEVKE
jgi:hypothetical protein